MEISPNTTFIAKTFYGLEDVLAREIRELGAKDIEILNRAVKFKGDRKLLYKANLYLHTALRILVPISNFKVSSYDELYEKGKKIKWDHYFTPDHTFLINSVAHSQNIDQPHFAALKLKDAIADQFRSKYSRRPSIDKEQPDYRINLHVFRTECTISIDSSGDSLYKRGYKVRSVKAPLNEVLAAGLIKLSGWDKKSPFIDPMCGSGTLPIEAALMAYDIPPGSFRDDFGFTKWKDYDRELHKALLEKGKSAGNNDIPIMGSDISERAIETSRNNAANAGFEGNIDFQVKAIENLSVENISNGTVIINPPYDIKLKEKNIREFYKNIGDILKSNFSGMDVWIFSGNKDAIKSIGLHPNRKITLYNASIESKFHYYPIYKGSLKKKKLD